MTAPTWVPVVAWTLCGLVVAWTVNDVARHIRRAKAEIRAARAEAQRRVAEARHAAAEAIAQAEARRRP